MLEPVLPIVQPISPRSTRSATFLDSPTVAFDVSRFPPFCKTGCFRRVSGGTTRNHLGSESSSGRYSPGRAGARWRSLSERESFSPNTDASERTILRPVREAVPCLNSNSDRDRFIRPSASPLDRTYTNLDTSKLMESVFFRGR